MPVLARELETAGFTTVLITMMPYWAERIGVPRTLAVEFPFGHTLGAPHDTDQQRRILLEAFSALETADSTGYIAHSSETWDEPVESAVQRWQPREPSPIIAELTPRFRDMLREYRRNQG